MSIADREKCIHSANCGGCAYQGKTYEEQLAVKEQFVRDCLASQGLSDGIMRPIVGCGSIYDYRNRMDYSFGNETKDGDTTLGLHKRNSFMSVFSVDHCQIVPGDFNRIVSATIGFCRERGYTHHNIKQHSGLLRSLVLRWGTRTGQLLVNIVTTSESVFDCESYRDLILGLPLENSVAGILRTINDGRADALSCDRLDILYGEPFYIDEVLGLKFKVGAFSFFQTNVEAAERLYRDALSLIPDIEGKTVYDLYCGTGTITQAMALKARKAIGVEIVQNAVDSARANAALNGLDNCEFICGDVQEVLASISEKPDVIVVDPPRMGMTPKALKQVFSYGVPQVLYISCNPKTMAENLRSAAFYGYRTDVLTPYDNFPFTKHVESVCCLYRQK